MNVQEIKEYNDVYNPLKVAFHMSDIEKIRNGELIPPKQLQIHPEGFCSNDCQFCAYRNSNWQSYGMNYFRDGWASSEDMIAGQKGKPKGKLVPEVSGLSKNIGLSIAEQMSDINIPAAEITGSGEPTLYPYIKEMFDSFAKHNIQTALVTHGQNLKPLLDGEHIQNLQWIRFSMDSCTPETHSKVHGVSDKMFPVAVSNIKKVVDLFPDAIIGISFIITQSNYHEILKAAEFYKNIGCDSIRFSFEYEPTGTAKLTPDQIDFARSAIREAKKITNNKFRVFGQVERLDSYVKPNIDFTFCGYQLFTWNIGYNGKVYPCCIMIYQDGFEFGDLNKQTLEKIAFSEFRRKYIDDFNVKRCHHCWMRDKNITIESLIAPEKRLGHVNYV
jgi:radical SAM protein with 4Fe4S-binding SPASM domain